MLYIFKTGNSGLNDRIVKKVLSLSIGLSVLLFFTPCGTTCGAGRGGVSGGSAHNTTLHNPWFIGEQPIRVCIRHSPEKFSKPKNEIMREFKEVFSDWKTTFDLLVLQNPLSVGNIFQQPLRITTTYTFEECTDQTELELYFGVHQGEELENALKKSVSPSDAIAHQVEFNMEWGSKNAGRASGFIWFRGDCNSLFECEKVAKKKEGWSRNNVFYNFALHELGHVYGFVDYEIVGAVPGLVPSLMSQAFLDGQKRILPEGRIAVHNPRRSSYGLLLGSFGSAGGLQTMCGALLKGTENLHSNFFLDNKQYARKITSDICLEWIVGNPDSDQVIHQVNIYNVFGKSNVGKENTYHFRYLENSMTRDVFGPPIEIVGVYEIRPREIVKHTFVSIPTGFQLKGIFKKSVQGDISYNPQFGLKLEYTRNFPTKAEGGDFQEGLALAYPNVIFHPLGVYEKEKQELHYLKRILKFQK